jgi:glycosyltransferase involved in cell wall biosynthesis
MMVVKLTELTYKSLNLYFGNYIIFYMKVLNILDIAGVASILAKYIHRLYNIETKVITRAELNPFNIPVYGDMYYGSAKLFVVKAILLARKYDIIHIHDVDILIPLFKLLYRKPTIIHYHGGSIRGKWERRRKFWSKADVIIVSTKDLLEGAPDNAIYLPNPVDTEHFYYRGSRKLGTAFHISYNADKEAKDIAKEFNLELTIHNRKENPINHTEMPFILSKYEYYIDIKRDYVTKKLLKGSLSKTALEALACGCKVITYNKSIVEGLPYEHKPQVITKRLFDIYSSLIR